MTTENIKEDMMARDNLTKVWRVSDLKEKYKEFHVTGQEVHGPRFRLVYTDPQWAFGINLWRGSVWGVLPTGKRELLKRA